MVNLSQEWKNAEIARLKAFVGDELLRSDYKSAAHMRAEITRLKAGVEAGIDLDASRMEQIECLRSLLAEANVDRDALRANLQECQIALDEAKTAIKYLFTPGPGIAVPEPFENDASPAKITWNEKLKRLRAIMEAKP